MKKFIIPVIILLAAGIACSQKIDRSVRKTLRLVDTLRIRERVIWLSDDKLRGRKPGSPGFQMAVDYVTEEFKRIGVAPKGDEGYLQRVIIRTARLDTAKCSITMGGNRMAPLRQITLLPDMNREATAGSGELVWVNFGITAPHLGHDDYKGLDVKGKVVMVRTGAPTGFPASEKAHFSGLANKGDIAARHGAAGLVLVDETDAAFNTMADLAVKGFMGFVNKDRTVGSGRMSTDPGLLFQAAIRPSVAERLLGRDLSPRALGVELSASVSTSYREITSFNVVGWIPGTDPVLKDEFVIHTAHLDHLGVGKPVKGDSIYNGAHDNASGTSCALEIAKLYKNAKTRRSVLIALVTAEEMGLLGSRFLAANPPVPKGSIVADINTDMPTLIAPMLSIEPLGAWHSTLIDQVMVAADHLGLDVQQDHMPDQVRFVRSDQYSFIRQGIPAMHVKYGLKVSNPAFDLRKHIDGWTEANYHKPSDEFRDETFNFEAAARYVKLNFLVGWQVANKTERPQWKAGDFFGETFGRK